LRSEVGAFEAPEPILGEFAGRDKLVVDQLPDNATVGAAELRQRFNCQIENRRKITGNSELTDYVPNNFV
jgi:hypothetical protein